MKLADFRNLDYQNIGGWPNSVKIFFCVALFALLLFLGWYLSISNQQDELNQKVQKEEQLKKEFSDKQAKVVNLDRLEVQLKEMQEKLLELIHQLPNETEMPKLLEGISQEAIKAGIQNELFQPGPETIKTFYAEKPITLRMIGTYHQFGHFMSGVAALKRVVILTMHDVSLKPNKDAKGTALLPGQLVLEGVIKTYRSVGDEEMSQQNAAQQPGKPGAPPPPPPPAPAKGGQ